jgi:hypothetical protein
MMAVSDDEEQDAATTVDLANTSSSSDDTAIDATSDQPTATIGTEPQPKMAVNEKRAVESSRSVPSLISLSTPSTRADDVRTKRTRSHGTTANEQEQPASKKLSQENKYVRTHPGRRKLKTR